jgi:hypothetical protein
MKREELETMTKDELREVAEGRGLELGSLDTKGTMVDKILGEYVAVATPKKAPVKEERLSPLGRLHTIDGKPVNGKKYRVTIFATEQDKSDVHLIVNGHNVQVRRGQEVVLDEAYVEVLRNAEINTVMQDPDTGVRSVQRMMVYPHTAVPV